NPVCFLFDAHEAEMEKIGKCHRSIETDEKYLPRVQNNLHGLMEIRERSRLKGFLEELYIALDQFGKYVFVVIQFREGFLHSAGCAQFAPQLLLDVSPELWEPFVT